MDNKQINETYKLTCIFATHADVLLRLSFFKIEKCFVPLSLKAQLLFL